jgi:hypothetical protein
MEGALEHVASDVLHQGVLHIYKEFLDVETDGGGRGPQGLIEVGSDCSGPRPGQ